ncbi:MAG: ribosomal-processing cysteine protease Prp [Ruminococcus sp.]|nr:ribosomal-processing cysteine protease Prp [Ruminococcus sp.]
MTEIVFFTDDDILTGFSLNGHSDYAQQGEDIVCAAISSATYMTVNTITDVLMIKPVLLNEADAVMQIQLNSKDAQDAESILKGFKLHIENLAEQYGDYIKLTIRR